MKPFDVLAVGGWLASSAAVYELGWRGRGAEAVSGGTHAGSVTVAGVRLFRRRARGRALECDSGLRSASGKSLSNSTAPGALGSVAECDLELKAIEIAEESV